jgi:hypothetical protein
MKQNPKVLDRREFTLRAALLALSGVSISISACGGGGSTSSSTPPPTAGSGDEVGSVSANHGHTAIIRAAELTAGNALNLDISGTAGHPHRVQLSSTEVSQIAGGTRVTKASSTDDGHSHDVTFN